MPMLHKYRYLSSLSLPQHMQPPICLRYAIWAQGASVSDDYKQYEEVLYERARKYVEQAEMKVSSEIEGSMFMC
jgi:phytoene/squalene synthetase